MLRLNPTQIRLEQRDLDWHLPRHGERQALRATAIPRDISKTAKRSPKKQKDSPIRHVPYPPKPAMSSKSPGNYDGPDPEIYCNEPVPTGNQSREFWNHRLAEVGVATTVRMAPVANARIVEPSSEFLDSTHSSRASLEEGSIDLDDINDYGREASQRIGLSPESWNPLHSNSPLPAEESQSNLEQAEQQAQSSRILFSILPGFRRRTRRDRGRNSDNVDLAYVNHSLSGSMAVDGPSDRSGGPPSHYRYVSGSSVGGPDNRLNDNLYGNLHDRRAVSVAESSSSSLVVPSIEPPPRAIGRSRNSSAGLPRSSLYISEAAPSSSPERPPRTPWTTNTNPFGSRGLLSLPPRRRRTYRARSQTYSWDQSEAMNPTIPQMDGPSTVQANTATLPYFTVSQPIGTQALNLGQQSPQSNSSATYSAHPSDPYLPSSPPDMPFYYGQGIRSPSNLPNSEPSSSSPHPPIEIRNYRSQGSIQSYYSRSPVSSLGSRIHTPTSLPSDYQPALPSRRRLSPFAAPFIPGHSPRISSGQFPLPPSFSSTPRTVSIPHTYPPSSPTSPHTPPQHRQSSATMSPSTHRTPPSRRPPSIAMTPPEPRTPRIAIYNDNLPPHTQPQTPAGLPRNGVPAMATQNPFWTQQTRDMGRHRAVADWQAFATPTRTRTRGRGWGLVEQENMGVIGDGRHE